MDDEMPASSQQTLSLFVTEGQNFFLDEGRCFPSTDNTLCISEHLIFVVLEQADVVCCLALVTCMNVIG